MNLEIQRPCLAADVMTPWPVTIRPDAPVSVAIALMIRHRIRHLPVVDRRRNVLGMLAESDLLAAIGDLTSYYVNRHQLTEPELLISDVTTVPVLVVGPHVPLDKIARTLADHRLTAIPVVDGFGSLLGVVSYVDVLRALAAM